MKRSGTPTGMVGVVKEAVTVIVVGVALVTLRGRVWVTPPKLATTFTGLLAFVTDVAACTRPLCVPTVASVVSAEVQLACDVTFNVLPFVKCCRCSVLLAGPLRQLH